MPQYPIPVDADPGGRNTVYNLSAATVLKTGAGRLRKLIVQTVGSSGSWTLNDCATTAAAAASNRIVLLAYNATGLVAGMPVTYDIPVTNGLVLSTVPGGSPAADVTYD